MSLKYSLFLPTGVGGELIDMVPADAYETLTRLTQIADEYSYETVWVPDHFHTVPPSQAMLFESWTTAAALARDTKRVRIGHMVTGNGYRNPALQAKMASTLDVLSHGRYTLGVGAGWYEHEYHAYGYPYSDGPERLRQLREAVQVILALWTQEEASFLGDYYQIRGAINQPKGVQQPHIPLLIAGDGEQVTLKLVAEFANACNVLGDYATIEHKFAVLKQHCKTLGRDYQSIRRTTLTLCVIGETDEQARTLVPEGAKLGFPGDVLSYGLIGSPETIRERLAAYEAAGVQELVIGFFQGLHNPDVVRRFATECML